MASEATRLALLRAAEQAFSERGVDSVSLREIARLAGQANSSATLYHFGDRKALLNALLMRHSDPMQQSFSDAFARKSEWSVRELVELLVRSVVEKLDDSDGGRAFVNISAQLAVSVTYPLVEFEVASKGGAGMLAAKLMHALQLPPELVLLRMNYVTTLIYGPVAQYGRMLERGMAPQLGADRLIADLVSAITGALEAPIPP